MRYCKKCLQPDTRPGIVFDENCVCAACNWQSQLLHKIDWDARLRKLHEIADWAKSKHAAYDCVIGVSGGKDSTFQAVYAKEELGLRVLLVNCEPDAITEMGKHNIENLINMGFDCIKIRTNPKVCRALARKSFYEYGNIVKPSEYPLWVSAYRIALNFNIPLIIQGENAALTLGVSKNQTTDGDAFNVTQLNTLAGCTAEEWVGDGVTEDDLYFYKFPDKTLFADKDIKAIWLQYYVKEWSQDHNTEFSVKRGLQGRTETPDEIGRYRIYSSVDSNMNVINQTLKYFKLGFGHVTDEVCYDIRAGKMTREEGLELVRKYDGKCADRFVKEAADYMGISVEEFWNVVDKWVNKKLFYKDENGKWQPKFTVGEDFNEEQ